ncbi:MAG TPA: peptidoglycan DD-metalloendopeptidase family protein [Myxococcaceae bacterium]|nr:peptidoglycan DD-metalloendopeptidase family protein [Myxococcaceae bacterium]
MNAVALLAALAALAQHHDPEAAAEHSSVQERLAAERAALATLKEQQGSVLEVIDLIERRARRTEERAALLDRELKALRRRGELAERREWAARVLLDESVGRLTPRLRALYRVQRRSRLDVILSADDFSSLVWRSRALSTLLERDLELVRDTQRAVHFQQRSRSALERVQETVATRARQLAFERALSLQQQELLAVALTRVAADAQQSARLVRELEQADRRLLRMIDQLEAEADNSAFAAMKGRLPWPAAGLIEVGFGKVVNPRFNTVTFQKGLDIRARPGAPVKAVAPGRVVYANWLRGYGNLLIVDHGGGYHTIAAHLARFSAGVGANVEAGAELGAIGDTGSLKGPYLYFELRKNGIAVDPAGWLAPSAP